MDEEYQFLLEHNTWKLTSRPPDTKVIRTKWVLTKKKEDDGLIRFKARLVAMGHTQKYGIDYYETSFLVIRHSSISILLTHASQHRMHVHHVDVKTAYLNGDVCEELYIEQPYQYVQSGQEDKVCLLQRSIYGLKQAALCWNRKLEEILHNIGLRKTTGEECIFTTNDEHLILGVYVADILIISASLKTINKLNNNCLITLKLLTKAKQRFFLAFTFVTSVLKFICHNRTMLNDFCLNMSLKSEMECCHR